MTSEPEGAAKRKPIILHPNDGQSERERARAPVSRGGRGRLGACISPADAHSLGWARLCSCEVLSTSGPLKSPPTLRLATRPPPALRGRHTFLLPRGGAVAPSRREPANVLWTRPGTAPRGVRCRGPTVTGPLTSGKARTCPSSAANSPDTVRCALKGGPPGPCNGRGAGKGLRCVLGAGGFPSRFHEAQGTALPMHVCEGFIRTSRLKEAKGPTVGTAV